MQNMSINNPYYIGDAIIGRDFQCLSVGHPPNLLDKFGEQIWRESPEKALKLDFSGGRPSAPHMAYLSCGYHNIRLR